MITPDTTVSIALVMMGISALGNAASIYGILRTKSKDDTSKDIESIKNFTEIKVTLDIVRKSVNDLALKADKQSETTQEIGRSISMCNGRIDLLEMTVDQLSDRVKNLEGDEK